MYSTYLLALGQRKQRGSQTPALRPSWRTVELSFPQVLGVRSECRFVENAVALYRDEKSGRFLARAQPPKSPAFFVPVQVAVRSRLGSRLTLVVRTPDRSGHCSVDPGIVVGEGFSSVSIWE